MKRLCISLISLFVSVNCFADDIAERLKLLVSSSNISELTHKGFVQHSVYREKGSKLQLMPSTDLARAATLFWTGEEAPFFVETLYLYKKTMVPRDSASDVTKISGILRSLSRLEGVEYYSTSRKQMRTLYEKSYAIDNPDSKRKIADSVLGSADGVVITALQKDLTFGEYVYRYSYRQTSDTVAFYSSNIQPMSYKFLKVINSENLHVSLVVQDLGDYLLIYGLTRANFLALPGLEGKLNASFSTRAEAIYKWFIKEYERQ